MTQSLSENKVPSVALFLADGCEEIEALTVADLLFRAGIPCTTVSITDSRTVVSSHKITIIADTVISDLSFDEYDMLVLPGGMPGTVNLGSCKALTDKVLEFAKNDKPIAAICAAPSVFANLGLLKGVPSVCNPGFEDKLIAGGADLRKVPALTSGKIITSRGMGTAIPFGLEIVAFYKGREFAEDLSRKILYTE